MRLQRYFFLALVCFIGFVFEAAAQDRPAENPVMIENNLEGHESWRIPYEMIPTGTDRIEGFASRTSINIGETIKFHVNVAPAQNVTIHIYRLGYYDKKGARWVDTIENKPVTEKQIPIPNGTTGLAECDWASDAGLFWNVPTTAVSGVYIAKLTGLNHGRQSYISFVVRDDARVSKILFQRSVTTDQAYNNYPGKSVLPHNGKSLYEFNSYGADLPGGSNLHKQARKVSFNRPYAITSYDESAPYQTAGGTLFTYDYNMIRWLESNGYDVTYSTNVDTHKAHLNGGIDNGIFAPGRHQAFLSVGHDEYWSWEMRSNIEQARNRATQPLNLGFFTGNAIYWQIRLEDSLLPNQTVEDKAHRVIVGYKEHTKDIENGDPFYSTVNNANNHKATNTWRENQANLGIKSKPPEDELMGVMFSETPRFDVTVNPAVISDMCPDWIKEGMIGQSLPGLVGFEADRIHTENVYTGRDLKEVGKSRYHIPSLPMQQHYSHMTFYTRDANQARVFAVGSLQWSWGLDNFNADEQIGPPLRNRYRRIDAETLTHNILRCLTYGICGTGEQL